MLFAAQHDSIIWSKLHIKSTWETVVLQPVRYNRITYPSCPNRLMCCRGIGGISTYRPFRPISGPGVMLRLQTHRGYVELPALAVLISSPFSSIQARKLMFHAVLSL
jgi:hypothetical protein